jgi:dolichol-phosphate mannosyltransferase
MISIVIPSYNEAGNIKVITKKLKGVLKEKEEFEIIFVDDGSTDQTFEEIKNIMKTEKFVEVISFSRNFGHQKALKAGLDHARGDCVISMDADLQHPPEVLPKLIDKWREGYDVVYTIRKDTLDIGFIKRITSKCFYKIINILSDVDIPLGAADFRLLDRKVVNELKQFKEKWLFIRGLVSWLGFRQAGIEYTVQPRLYALYIKIFTNASILGWTSIMISVLFIGGIQLICIGMIGEYLGKMFIETKERPNYVIREKSI